MKHRKYINTTSYIYFGYKSIEVITYKVLNIEFLSALPTFNPSITILYPIWGTAKVFICREVQIFFDPSSLILSLLNVKRFLSTLFRPTQKSKNQRVNNDNCRATTQIASLLHNTAIFFISNGRLTGSFERRVNKRVMLWWNLPVFIHGNPFGKWLLRQWRDHLIGHKIFLWAEIVFAESLLAESMVRLTDRPLPFFLDKLSNWLLDKYFSEWNSFCWIQQFIIQCLSFDKINEKIAIFSVLIICRSFWFGILLKMNMVSFHFRSFKKIKKKKEQLTVLEK